MKPTRALSIRPQWIEAIMTLGKRWENRDWPEGYAGLAAARRLVGETIYLHAGQGSRADYEAGAAWIASSVGRKIRPWKETTRGALVATARLVAVVDSDDPRADVWTNPGDIGLILAEVTPLPRPVPCSGKLGFFHVVVPPRSPAPPVKCAPISPTSRVKRVAHPTPAPKKPATDWHEAGRKAYKTKLRNAAARGDRDAAAKLAALRD
jgi:hypothetical protein